MGVKSEHHKYSGLPPLIVTRVTGGISPVPDGWSGFSQIQWSQGLEGSDLAEFSCEHAIA